MGNFEPRMLDPHSSTSTMGADEIATLRELRCTGPLGELGAEAQSTLLGATLYEYSDSVTPTRIVEARRLAMEETLATTQWSESSSEVDATQAMEGLRVNVSRILGGSTINMGNNSLLNAPVGNQTLLPTQSTLGITPVEPLGEISEEQQGARLNRTIGFLEESLESVSSLAGGGRPTSVLDSQLHADAVEASASPLSPLGSTLRSNLMLQTARSVWDARDQTGYELTGTLQGLLASQNEDLTAVLQRLAAMDAAGALDESLARSVRRVLLMGTALTGARLADDDVRSLPKVRFDLKEEQQCSICLEHFRQGELLTQLPCDHFFHVDCIAKWFQRSAQCPLCRSECAPTAENDFSPLGA